jgi:CheY-like chemotaxis protein
MAKIMLVEDDNNLREIYEARLLAEGYDIVSARDGEEALAMAVREKPDLIISDIMMPKISGFDMLDIIRSTPETKNTKVIMMTALSQVEDKARADKLGADRYLVKSQVTLEDVAKASRDLLESDEVGGSSAGKGTLPPPSYSEPQQPRREATIMPMQQESPEETQADVEPEQEQADEQEEPIEQPAEPETETVEAPAPPTPVQPTTSDDEDSDDEEDSNDTTSQDDAPEIEPENGDSTDFDSEKKNDNDEEAITTPDTEADNDEEANQSFPSQNGFGSEQLGQAEAPGTVISPSGNFQKDEEPVVANEEDNATIPEAEVEPKPVDEPTVVMQETIATSATPSSQTPVQSTTIDDVDTIATSQDDSSEAELEDQIENFIATEESQATYTPQTTQEPPQAPTQAPPQEQATETPTPTVITPSEPPKDERPTPTAPPVVQQESDGKTKTVKGERVLQPLHDPKDNSSLEKLIAEEQAKDVNTDAPESAPTSQEQSTTDNNIIKPKGDEAEEQSPGPDTEAEEFLKAANLNNQPAEPNTEPTSNEVPEADENTPQVQPNDISI